MNAIDFKEANITLRAGDNPNTIGLRSCISRWNMMPGFNFYVSKWEMSEHEKEAYKKRLDEILFEHAESDLELDYAFIIKTVLDNLPPVYLSQMNAPVPVMVLSESPFDEPNFLIPNDDIAGPLNKPNAHPKEN